MIFFYNFKVILFILILPLLFISCSEEVSPYYGLNQVFELKFKNSAQIDNIEIFFDEVNDSRCPADINCSWVGNATITLRVSQNGVTSYAIVTIDGNVMKEDFNFQKDVFIFNYKITLMQLDPYPASNVRIARASYKATLLVTKI